MGLGARGGGGTPALLLPSLPSPLPKARKPRPQARNQGALVGKPPASVWALPPAGTARSHGSAFWGPATPSKPVSGLLPRLQATPCPSLRGTQAAGVEGTTASVWCLVEGPQPGVSQKLPPSLPSTGQWRGVEWPWTGVTGRKMPPPRNVHALTLLGPCECDLMWQKEHFGDEFTYRMGGEVPD